MKRAKARISKINWIQKTCPPNQQTSNTLQQIKDIMRDVMKPQTIIEILENLKIITTAINQIMTATVET